jgi:hypothetical protein
LDTATVDNDYFAEALRNVKALYAKTKGYILRAEEIDPSLRSNIAVFKEQRDGLDHIMRAVSEYLDKGSAGDKDYVCKQFEDAQGHFYRAAYDALDGMGISYKLRINQVVSKFSIQAILTGYPDYASALDAIDAVDERIIQHRNNKDQRRTTLADLDDYFDSIKTIDLHSKAILRRVPFIRQVERAEKRKAVIFLVLLPIGIAVMLIAADFARDCFWRWREDKRRHSPVQHATPAPSAISPSASP